MLMSCWRRRIVRLHRQIRIGLVPYAQEYDRGTMQCVGQSLGLAVHNACVYQLRHKVYGVTTDGDVMVRLHSAHALQRFTL